MMLPPYDTRETLRGPGDVVARFAPRAVIALGDSFHDIGGPERLGHEERAALARRAGRARSWIWVTGNHDRTLPASIGGEVVGEMRARRHRAPATSPQAARRPRSPATCIRSARW